MAKEGWKNQGVCGTECVECPAIQDKSVVCRALGKAETEQPSLAIPVGPGLSTEPLFDIVDWYVYFSSKSSNGDWFSSANKTEKCREECWYCHHVGE
ncbi:hypothetical protein GCM10020218_080480 [Dactylosporangium vinaceum]